MTVEEYLENLVQSQSNIPEKYLIRIKQLKEKVRDIILKLDKISKKPTPYDAGSIKKRTMIKESFDIDLLFYYPSDTDESLEDIFYYVEEVINNNFKFVRTKNVSIRIDFPNEDDLEKHDFHVDVVPAKRKTDSDIKAWIYKSKDKVNLMTSLEEHVKAVQNFGRYGILKLLKLWKVRKRIDCPSIVIELIAFEALKNEDRSKIKRAEALKKIFNYITTIFPNRKKIEDPANPSHNLLDEEIISKRVKENLIKWSEEALKENLDTQNGWQNIFQKVKSYQNSYSYEAVKQRKGKIDPEAPNTRRFG